jgi:hypothetical protein
MGRIRTRRDLADSVSCRFHVRADAVDASAAVAPCTLSHARPRFGGEQVAHAFRGVQIAGTQPTLSAAVAPCGVRPRGRFPSVLDRPLRHLSALESTSCGRSEQFSAKPSFKSCCSAMRFRFSGLPTHRRPSLTEIVSDLSMSFDHLRRFSCLLMADEGAYERWP